MFWWSRELLACLRFLSVNGEFGFWKSKRIYEFVLPMVMTMLATVAYCVFPQFFVTGFVTKFLALLFQFMVFVVPFHLAALAAFATFERDGLDDKLTGANAQIRRWSNVDNGYLYFDLTLRQYASLLFGYLCAIGIAFIIFYLLASNINYAEIFSKEALPTAKQLTFAVSFFFVSHYSVLSLYAITFLFDKVNKIGH